MKIGSVAYSDPIPGPAGPFLKTENGSTSDQISMYGPGVRGHALPPQDLSVNLKEFLSNSFCFCCFHLHNRVLTVAIIMFTKTTNSTNAVSGRPAHFLAPLLLAPLLPLPSSFPFPASLLLFRVKDPFQIKLAILYQMNVFCKKTQNTT